MWVFIVSVTDIGTLLLVLLPGGLLLFPGELSQLLLLPLQETGMWGQKGMVVVRGEGEAKLQQSHDQGNQGHAALFRYIVLIFVILYIP
jgi:hypothetical protein